MGKIRNLCMTQLVRMKKIKEPDMYTWIFSSVDNCYYNYNSRYLFEYVKEHLPQITPIFVINEEGLRRELSKKYGEWTEAWKESSDYKSVAWSSAEKDCTYGS